jgi:hypothetical protein
MKLIRNTWSTLVLLVLSLWSLGQTRSAPSPAAPPLSQRIQHFELTDAILREGIIQLASNRIAGLHLGFEEIQRDNISDNPRNGGVQFSIQLENKTIHNILDALCEADARYTWSSDGISINIYPRATSTDSAYLLNRTLEHISFENVPDPDEALTPIAQQLRDEQIGYTQTGGDVAYAKPWTASFQNITVRQLINRIAEHIGPQSLWIWQGGKDERMFTFEREGLKTYRQPRGE